MSGCTEPMALTNSHDSSMVKDHVIFLLYLLVFKLFDLFAYLERPSLVSVSLPMERNFVCGLRFLALGTGLLERGSQMLRVVGLRFELGERFSSH